MILNKKRKNKEIIQFVHLWNNNIFIDQNFCRYRSKIPNFSVQNKPSEKLPRHRAKNFPSNITQLVIFV